MSNKNKELESFYDSAILETLRYRSIFSSRVTFHQLCTFFICPEEPLEIEINEKVIKQRLEYLIKKKRISYKKGLYYLFGHKTVNWNSRAANSRKLLKEAYETANILKQIKWIKMLAVTGSVAAYNAQKKDDIDVFIITEKNRLWLTRFFVVLLLKLHNKYRTDENFHKKVCPNIYLSDDALMWEKSKQNIYTAHEILLMHPLINRDDTYFKFISSNKWLFSYFPFFKVNMPKKPKASSKYNSSIIDTVEFIAMTIQLWYMRDKKTTEVVSSNFIHFNKFDHAEKILKDLDNV